MIEGVKHRLAPAVLCLVAFLLPSGAPAAEKWFQPPGDAGAVAPAPLPVEVLPDNASLHYSGRFEHANSKEALCAWSATAVTVRFRGTAVNVRLGTGANRFEAVVDGVPVKILSSATADLQAPPNAPSPTWYALAAGLPEGEHRATVFKCTEAAVGNGTFAGFQLNAGAAVLPAAPERRKIEVIGDSISCGYGNEAAAKEEHFSPATENAWWTYGAITARALGADYECIAWSGRKMYPDNTLPGIYDLTLPRDPASHWAGDKEKPDVILVNLCTNDFRFPQPPEHAGWVKAYREFLARLRRGAPQATIYCALGSMMSDGYPSGRPSLTMAREWIQEVVKGCNDAGDDKVHFLEFAGQQAANGYGADWHPSVRTHQIMAEKLVGAIRTDLHW